MKRTPIARKRKTARRRPPVVCSTQRCSRRPSVELAPDERYCKTHAMRLADKLCGDAVKGYYGGCVVGAGARIWHGPYFACSGSLQWAHLIPRGYRSTRHDFENALALCASHHRWMDTHPVEKDEMMRDWLGDWYDSLRSKALTHDAPDLADVIRHYRAVGRDA